MMTNPHLVKSFEQAQIRESPVDYRRDVEIVEALCHEARLPGSWPPSGPLGGLDTDPEPSMFAQPLERFAVVLDQAKIPYMIKGPPGRLVYLVSFFVLRAKPTRQTK